MSMPGETGPVLQVEEGPSLTVRSVLAVKDWAGNCGLKGVLA
jgi:hypothetical protein